MADDMPLQSNECNVDIIRVNHPDVAKKLEKFNLKYDSLSFSGKKFIDQLFRYAVREKIYNEPSSKLWKSLQIEYRNLSAGQCSTLQNEFLALTNLGTCGSDQDSVPPTAPEPVPTTAPKPSKPDSSPSLVTSEEYKKNIKQAQRKAELAQKSCSKLCGDLTGDACTKVVTAMSQVLRNIDSAKKGEDPVKNIEKALKSLKEAAKPIVSSTGTDANALKSAAKYLARTAIFLSRAINRDELDDLENNVDQILNETDAGNIRKELQVVVTQIEDVLNSIKSE
ncbi:hypothetical protein Y032_0015g2629 [Ancylostoma ceylanicum]|uniref:Uncharacterized protein n=1 Tax=Ancylostoma ceylanicum TaxID=53326 RepID=A0A016V9I8_9BILA|nr:hypothetical protein Y032_0015g2629 [Ancylostoma ceylanicum]